jgi:hypothetical protein
MTRAYSPRRLVEPDTYGRQIGQTASAGSANAVLVPLASQGGRLVPVYSLRPTPRPTDATEGAPVDTWTVPYLPTHGAWREVDEADIAGEPLTSWCGGVQPQFGPACALTMVVRIESPNGRGPGALLSLDGDVVLSWDDYATSETDALDTTVAVLSRSLRLDDPGDILDPWALSARYGDVGPYAFSGRDCYDARLLGSGLVSSDVVQSDAADEAITDGATAIGAVSVDAPGTATTTARVYIGWASVTGANADAAPVAYTAAGASTVIPTVVGLTDRYGAPGPLTSQILTAPVRALAYADRTVYATRGATLTTYMSSGTTGDTGPRRPLKSANDTDWVFAVRGLFHRLPADRLPGSADVRVAGSGGAASTRGALVGRVLIADAECRVGVRKVTIAGSYGQSSTFGAWVWQSAVEASTTATWHAVTALLPTGILPGDDYEVGIAFRADTGSSAGYLLGWWLREGDLSDVA